MTKIIADGLSKDAETVLLTNVRTAAEEAGAAALSKEGQKLIDDNPKMKEVVKFLGELKDCKTREELGALMPQLSVQLTAFDEALIKLKADIEKPRKSKVTLSRDMHSIERCFLRGLRDMQKKGLLNRAAIDKHRELVVRTSKLKMDDRAGKLVKLAVDAPMSEAVSIIPIGSGIPNIITQFEPELIQPTRRKAFIAAMVDLASTTGRYYSWMEKTNILNGQAYMVAEGGSNAASYGSFRATQNSAECQKINALVELTDEILEDYSEMKRLVQEEVLEIIQLKLDSQILNGAGTGNNLKGILEYAQGFVNNTNVAVIAPNNMDALIAAIYQMRTNGDIVAAGAEPINIYEPTDIILHPGDVEQMDLTKDTLTQYIIDKFQYVTIRDQMVTMLKNCRITENIGMLQGSYLVSDIKKSHVRIREDAELKWGFINTDFQDGLIRLKGEIRAVHFIANNQVKSQISDTFNNTKNLIQAA